MRYTILVLALLNLALCLTFDALFYLVLYTNEHLGLPAYYFSLPPYQLWIVPVAITAVLGSLGASHARKISLPDWRRMFRLLLVPSILGPVLAPIIFFAGSLADFNNQAPATVAATTLISYLLLLPPIFIPAFALLYFFRSSTVPVPPMSAPEAHTRVWGLFSVAAVVVTTIGLLLTPGALYPSLLFKPSGLTTSPTGVPSSYTALLPGPTCDTGAAQWISLNPASTVIECSASGLRVTDRPNIGAVAAVGFVWPGHPFPRDYEVDVDISGLTGKTCAGVITRSSQSATEQGTGYISMVCADGMWVIQRRDASSGSPANLVTLASGRVEISNPDNTYRIRAISSGTSQQLSINNAPPIGALDSTYTNTSEVSLVVSDSQGGVAIFTDFRYAPAS
jgi:hypothetical protein